MRKGSGDLELAILGALSTLKEASVKEVQQHLGEGYAYTTIMTVLNRLYKKGEVTRYPKGRQYRYQLAETTLLQRIKRRLVGQRPAAVISYLIATDETLTDKELERIEEILQARKRES